MTQSIEKQLESVKGRLPTGSYPAMLTSFGDDGAIDWDGIDRLTDDCIDRGAAGIFACGLSAEVVELDVNEQVALAERIVRRADGRVPIVAGAISSGPTDVQAELIRRVHGVGADVVAIAVCNLADEQEDVKTWIKRVESLLEQLPSEIRLSMYECPLPYHRVLSDDAIRWTAATDRFRFLKDTCCQIETIERRLEIVRGSRLQLLNANTQTLLVSLQAGVDGFCGIGANYMPELYAWLCKHFRDTPQLAAELQEFLTQTVDLTESQWYPASAKTYLQKQGLDIGTFSRRTPNGISEECVQQLAKMRAHETRWLQRLASKPERVEGINGEVI